MGGGGLTDEAQSITVPVLLDGRSNPTICEVVLPRKIEPIPDQDFESNYNLQEKTMYRKYNLQEVQRSERRVKEHPRDAISKTQTGKQHSKWPGSLKEKERERERFGRGTYGLKEI